MILVHESVVSAATIVRPVTADREINHSFIGHRQAVAKAENQRTKITVTTARSGLPIRVGAAIIREQKKRALHRQRAPSLQ